MPTRKLRPRPVEHLAEDTVAADVTAPALLPGETREAYEKMRRDWYEQFPPQDCAEAQVLEQLVLNDLLRQRANRSFLEVQTSIASAQPNPAHFDKEQERKLDRALRHKTAAERVFFRALTALQALRKSRRSPERVLAATKEESVVSPPAAASSPRSAKNKPQGRPGSVFQGQRAQAKHSKKDRPHVLDQWVEIERAPDGRTITTLYPSNEQLVRHGQSMWPPPNLVYRRLNFLHGVPPEYSWAGGSEIVRERGGMGIQRMDADHWVELSRAEEATGTGHIGPCGGNLPRPEERGDCECPVCTLNRALLEKNPDDHSL
jgi:hypothetical protein